MGSLVEKLAFPGPFEGRYASERALLAHPGLVFLETAGGDRIPAVFFRAGGKKARFTILYSHGNATAVGGLVYTLQLLSEKTGADVFAYEYPGYSVSTPSEHKASEKRCYQAVDAAMQYLVESEGVSPRSLVLFGRSLGTGPTCDLASRTENLAGTVLQSPLSSAIHCIPMGSGISMALSRIDIFKNIKKVGNINHPVLVVHGTADKVVPIHNGKAILKRLKQPSDHSHWYKGRGHNDMPTEDIFKRVRNFLEQLAGLQDCAERSQQKKEVRGASKSKETF